MIPSRKIRTVFDSTDRLYLLLAACVLLAMGGCRSDRGGPSRAGSDADVPVFVSQPTVASNPNDSAPLAAVLRFESSKPVTTRVRVWDGFHVHTLTYSPDRKPEEGLPVIGLRPDREHTIQVNIRDADGNETTYDDVLKYTTPPLPSGRGQFPSIHVPTRHAKRMAPGYTLLNPRRRVPRQTQLGTEEERRFGANFGMLLIVDDHGTPVWYYRSDSRISDFEQLPNGNIQYVTHDYRIVEIDPLGNIVRSWYAADRPQGSSKMATPVDVMTFHHDADRLPSGDVLALSTDRRKIADYYTSARNPDAPRKDQWVMGDRIVWFNANGEIQWDWNTFEHMDPYRIGYETFFPYWKRRGYPDTLDWSHANAVVYDPGDDAVLVNFRYQSAILKIDRSTGEVIWIFGEPGGWPERFEEKLIKLEGDARWPWHQHSPVLTERGTLLLFDNGNYRARPFNDPMPVAKTYSRAVEYRINEQTLTARQVWSSEIPGEKRVVSIAMGAVQDLPDAGNVLAGFGAILDPEGVAKIDWQTRGRIGQWTRVREYTRTDPPEVVWEMQLRQEPGEPPISWNIFGAHRIRHLMPSP